VNVVDFTNILCTAFTRADSKSAKNTVKLSVLFARLGFRLVKALRKTLVKSTPGWVHFLRNSPVCFEYSKYEGISSQEIFEK